MKEKKKSKLVSVAFSFIFDRFLAFIWCCLFQVPMHFLVNTRSLAGCHACWSVLLEVSLPTYCLEKPAWFLSRTTEIFSQQQQSGRQNPFFFLFLFICCKIGNVSYGFPPLLHWDALQYRTIIKRTPFGSLLSALLHTMTSSSLLTDGPQKTVVINKIPLANIFDV